MSERAELRQLIRATASESLPSDYVALTARRFGIATAATAALHLVYITLYGTVWSAQSHAVGMSAAIVGFFASVAAAAYLLSAERPARHVTWVGVAYEISLSFALSLSQSMSVDYAIPTAQVPWVAVLIVLFPFLIPGSTRLIISASVASAAMVPLAMVLMFELTHRPWPSPTVFISFILPGFLCAFLAWAPTSALHRLGVAVQSARRLGNYELVERLGQGGMGDVWRANHRLLARPAAVKLIKPEMLGAKNAASRAALVRRFEQEAQATASLDSVHTVELYDFGVSHDGVLFYVMELLHGSDLQSLVERFGPLRSGRVIHLLAQACDSLQDAHCRGLIHRDIKPANLFVARKGVVCDFLKVLDFGLVKRWRAEDETELSQSLEDLAVADTQQTAAGQIIGTPAFLAPEAALGQVAPDVRADIYALGCVGYFMLTGQPVFAETSAVAMAVAHVTKEPEPPSQRAGRAIDAELERLVLECLSKDREQRPRTAAVLRERLSAINASEPWSAELASAWWREHLPESATVSRAQERRARQSSST